MTLGVLMTFVVGLVLLVIGAEVFVRGASRLARLLGLTPLVIGLTIVALGTSSPEIAVSLQSSLEGKSDLALGNVVGSNIFNILLILGLAAMITPLVVAQQLVRLDVPIMIAGSVLVLLFGLDGRIGAIEGVALIAAGIAYTAFLIYQSRREKSPEVQEEYEKEFGVVPSGPRQWVVNLALIVGGLVILILGSRWLVESAVSLAQAMGVSELVIGLTIVAAGTSLPEVATSIIASLRGERDIAVGNAVGSCIFNIFVVLGIAGLIAPDGILVAPAALSFDIPVMIAVAVASLPIFFTGNLIARWEGLVFFAYYVAYTLYVILRSTEHDALPIFSTVMIAFVMPLTVVTLAVLFWRSLARRRARRISTR